MGSLALVGILLVFFPYIPWIILLGAVEKPNLAGALRLAQYSALSQLSLLALWLAGPFSWAYVPGALYLITPFHLGLFLSNGVAGVKGDWQERLDVILANLMLLIGQVGVLLLVWS